MNKYIYSFGGGQADGSKDMKSLLGGKGANLAEMTNIGLPVPAGFTISTEVCKYYYENSNTYPPELEKEIDSALRALEETSGKKFGDARNPLLVSVRSGAAVSMPGMMDTVLNLGLNEETVAALAAGIGNDRFAWDAYRRFIQMFGNVVEGIEYQKFEHILETIKKERGVEQDTRLTAQDLKTITLSYKELYKNEKNEEFPTDPKIQLQRSIHAVFGSWNNERAIKYRQINKVDESQVFGTAVNVQAMVFGNMGDDSGTGVAFTRNPSTGEGGVFGEYLMNAQGEDVVAGIRTPKPITALKDDNSQVYEQLISIFDILEKHYKDMQDVEFTIENGTLYILQTRNGKRTGPAAVRIAVEMVEEGLIDEKNGLLKVQPEQLDQLLHPMIDPAQKKNFTKLAEGLPASPGAVSGKVVFNAIDAVEQADTGEKVILVRAETSPEDIAGMHASQGILTARGGMTSHAAVVARGMGKCCVAGCGEIVVSEADKTFRVGDKVIAEGDIVTLDGSAGEVYLDHIPTIKPTVSGNFAKLMEWADKYRQLGVRTNADTPADAQVARDYGAEGIGLCRTEHMFFEEDRIFAVRQMIVSETKEQREAALAKIFPMQKSDFKALFSIMAGLPVKIRLLDPPLHEFLPKEKRDIVALAREMGITTQKLEEKIEQLHEFNPMMGHRGCRLGITFPEIYQMQVKAIIQAACELKKEQDMEIVPEIMIPLVGDINEYKIMQKYLEPVIKQTMKDNDVELEYEMGTMIEIPRAALTADEIAKEAEFFSFGTNDLTQMTFGFSRDDSGSFLKQYVNEKILPEDPFQSVDQVGVGKLMNMTVDMGRKVRPGMHIGICGEQGGDPKTIHFCHQIGLTYVSCSPYRVPIARLAAAQAALES
ncbi:pyruvate, phosphate dikinase [candidate division WWE3 bacterium CG08_land_8_20_14_0_20_43_13]|uniref:Pyruvate, phosphate dikinase n=1 Tax=candidate division WWE3 bacterium CG08_land_8_20_14_0_20_43_13 TaxID=1975087 RepID=A0A2H0X7P3_UNCKA|nr:MAG: pyruvate, phosphate dikinase [candidate division WWE3 bacterium CG08_land_8_20_14_0_20_43_13]